MILLIVFIMCIMTALSSENVNHHHNQQQQSINPNYQSSMAPLNLPPSLSPSFLTPPTMPSNSNSNLNNVFTSSIEYNNNNDINNFYKNNNLSSQDESMSQYIPYEQRLETYMVPIIFAFIFLIGSISNGLTILIIFRERLYRSPSYLFILNLALGDLIVILGSVPFVATIYTFESWPYGKTVCRLSEFIRDVSVSVTVLTLTVMSYDRYKATFALSPRSNLKNYSRPATGNRRNPPPIGPTPFHVKLLSFRYVNIVTGIWIVSAIIGLPAAINSYLLDYDVLNGKTIKVCYPFPRHLDPWYPQVVVSLKFLVLYLIPLIVICFCYTLISLKLNHYSKSNSTLVNPANSRLQSGLKLTTSDLLTRRHRFRRRIVIFFVAAFAICFFPSHIFLLWFYWDPTSRYSFSPFWHVLRIAGFILSFTNSCLNPIILYLTSQRFRAETKNYLGRFLKKYYNDDNHHSHHSHQQCQPEGCESPVRTY